MPKKGAGWHSSIGRDALVTCVARNRVCCWMADHARNHQRCGCISQAWQLLQTGHVVINHRSRRDPMDKLGRRGETRKCECIGSCRCSGSNNFFDCETCLPCALSKVDKPLISLVSFGLALQGRNSGHVPVVIMEAPELATGQLCECDNRARPVLAHARSVHA